MNASDDVLFPSSRPNPLPDQHFVMVRTPSRVYAGHVGAEAVVTDVANGSVYVLFESGMRECYPPKQFHNLFRRRALRRTDD